MKSKKIISFYLIFLILVSVGFGAWYTLKNKDKIFSSDNASGSGSSVTDSKDYKSSSNETTNSSTTQDNLVYDTDNGREDYGVKKVKNYIEFLNLIERKENTFLVLGREGCHFCELYEPVLEEVAALYKIEIDYIDIAALSKEDRDNIFKSSLTIPAKCTNSNVDSKLADGFGTPLSLFIKDGNSYNCLRGYKDKVNLVSSLRGIGYIN